MGRLLIPEEMVAGEYLFARYGATVADYDRAADEDTRLELIDGVLMMHSPANVRHEKLFWFLGRLMQGYAEARELGLVLGSRTPMFLDDERRFEPDLLFIATEHLSRLEETALVGPADLVVEILSPATREYDLGQKRTAYAEGGVAEYWIIDPQAKELLVDRPAGVRVAQVSSGEVESQVMPGFKLDVAWLWQEPPADAGACLAQILGR